MSERNINKVDEWFPKDVVEHEMKVLLDDGAHRHLHFKNPTSSNYWFEVITWDGSLCIHGDCGTFVFSRLPDMFDFFRMGEGRSTRIKPDYWGEKCQSVDAVDGMKEFSGVVLQQIVESRFDDFFDDGYSKEAKEECWKAIENEVLCYGNEHETREALSNFEHGDFKFRESWEWNLTDYTFRYLWCCYAIVWAIEKYDEWKKKSIENEPKLESLKLAC